MDNKPLVVNFFGGPSCGKSTSAAGLFFLLKLHNINAELVTELAKDFTWEHRFKTLKNQYYIWGKQYHRLWRVKNEVDIIITDSPILNSLVYGEEKPNSFYDLVKASFNEFNNLNFFIKRFKQYNTKGRSQTEEEAIQLDKNILSILDNNNIKYEFIEGTYSGINHAMEKVLDILNRKNNFSIEKK